METQTEAVEDVWSDKLTFKLKKEQQVMLFKGNQAHGIHSVQVNTHTID